MSVYIIAEAALEHNGNIETAKEMVDIAKMAKVDAVKFQLYVPEENAQKDTELYDVLVKSALTLDELAEIQDYCNGDKEIDFLCSAFDIGSLRQLKTLGLKTLKIPSQKIADESYLSQASILFDNFIISTGMAGLDEIDKIIDVFFDNNVTVLHCVSAYPPPLEDMNLRAIITMKEELDVPIGLSDHSIGWEIPIAAVALGAEIIEKHFTLDRSLKGPDASVSLEPLDLLKMVSAIRDIEKALGDGNKRCMDSEKVNLWRRNVV